MLFKDHSEFEQHQSFWDKQLKLNFSKSKLSDKITFEKFFPCLQYFYFRGFLCGREYEDTSGPNDFYPWLFSKQFIELAERCGLDYFNIEISCMSEILQDMFHSGCHYAKDFPNDYCIQYFKDKT